MRFDHRVYEEELMDDLDSGGEVIDQTLRELETINKWLGGNYVTINGILQLLKGHSPEKPLVIADLGCGGGDILKLVATWAKKAKVPVELHGYDANPNIIKYAEENCAEFPEISFHVEDIFSEDFKQNTYDIVLCTLFTHHFTDNQLIKIFHQFKEQAKKGVVINDLHRHWLAYHSIKLLTQLFSKSPMVKYDAPLSVRRSFRRNDLKKIMSEAGVSQFSLKWMWAFRWQLIF
ncbi:methyltransferase domain-containing protein [Roseivirga misakiensis]|uniref:SAM-dependent methyltransferase n=1 Tax=Roseivirga misakiensis TaxID=1563681 RepID=A0A1E5T6Q1_9BACT|nr:methyltransferase domain-containing protein [Roseivirga misakiensis]OEK07065.1 SAM-dependent methyltransferase [Roseivirga misakiensis]